SPALTSSSRSSPPSVPAVGVLRAALQAAVAVVRVRARIGQLAGTAERRAVAAARVRRHLDSSARRCAGSPTGLALARADALTLRARVDGPVGVAGDAVAA